MRRRVPCQSAKKNVRFLRIGPPNVKPYWFRRNSGFPTRLRKIVPGVQVLIAEEFEDRAVELVAAGLPDHHYRSAVGSSVFGRVGVEVESEFLHRVDDWIEATRPGSGWSTLIPS